MAPRGPCLLLFLILTLLAASLAQFVPLPSYQQFLRQHVDFPKTNAANDHRYCNLIIQRRRLPCTPTHDFINAHPRQIRNICSRGGRCYSRYNQCDSKAAYKLTRCRLVRRNPGARCVYRGRTETRRIRLACDNERLPVRLVRVL